MASPPESDLRLSVPGQGFAEDKLEKRNRGISALDVSAGTSEDPNDSSESSMDDIWRALPEEILDIIPRWLPFAAQRRFRCVCKSWSGVQSIPPSHTALSQSEDGTARFYCESERKWFKLPSNNLPTFTGKVLTDTLSSSGQQFVQMNEDVVDVEGGIMCYQINVGGGQFWFWICNPLGTSMSQLVVPSYSLKYPPKHPMPKVKLLVDRANKTEFKIIALLDKFAWTAVYESTTSRWQFHTSHPRYRLAELFSWENVIHVYSTELKRFHQGNVVATFNTESGEWTEIKVKIPSCEIGFPTHHRFVSDNCQLLLILFSNRHPRPYLSVWKLLGPSTTSEYRTKWAKWQQIFLEVKGAVADLAGHGLTSACCGPEYICFGFSDDRIKEGGKVRTHKCVRYSFAAQSWSMMQCPGIGGSGGNFTLYNWEPNVDMNPSLASTPSIP